MVYVVCVCVCVAAFSLETLFYSLGRREHQAPEETSTSHDWFTCVLDACMV